MYAPTAQAPPQVKQRFVEDLQDTVDRVPASDVMVMLGDFDARVGQREVDSDLWQGTWEFMAWERGMMLGKSS